MYRNEYDPHEHTPRQFDKIIYDLLLQHLLLTEENYK